jgi:hypothetical protein
VCPSSGARAKAFGVVELLLIALDSAMLLYHFIITFIWAIPNKAVMH